MFVSLSVCICFPNRIQPEAIIHFNKFRFSIKKRVITTLHGVSDKHYLMTLLCTITKTRLFKYMYIENFTSKN